MKFEEKLIILRKQNLLSQEGLAEKLDVTRQTVSKWELGQSRPDMDKLTVISKLFDVSIDVLINDEISLDTKKEQIKEDINKSSNNKKRGNRKFLLYIFILIFIASLTTLSYRAVCYIKEIKDAKTEELARKKEEAAKKQQEIEEKIKKQQEEAMKEAAKSDFNHMLEFYSGTEIGDDASRNLDEVIKNNKKSTDKLIEVIFDGTSYGTDPENIKTIKSKLKNFNGYKFQYYEILLDYDVDGYVNKVTIETKKGE